MTQFVFADFRIQHLHDSRHIRGASFEESQVVVLSAHPCASARHARCLYGVWTHFMAEDRQQLPAVRVHSLPVWPCDVNSRGIERVQGLVVAHQVESYAHQYTHLPRSSSLYVTHNML